MTDALAAALSTEESERSATMPPEARGLRRDEVRLLVSSTAGIRHARFRQLPGLLEPGDVVVVNTSATLAAAVDGRRQAGPVTVHLAGELPDGTWVVELRPGRRAAGPVRSAVSGEVVVLPAGRVVLVEPYPDPAAVRTRLWRSRVLVRGSVPAYLAANGRPITYPYVPDDWPLDRYQTVFAREPGSAEMPSAGRPFSAELVVDLVATGIAVAPLCLHTGVSSPEAHELPVPEPYRVPEATARLVNGALAAGRRVVAVGTTVTRALESVATADGTVRPGSGWTDLVLGPDRPARVVNALVTGWHQPGASHLLLLEAVAGPEMVSSAYAAAREAGYLWHEFGDSALFLP